jgi:polyhydroxyalkanoate synthase
VVAPAAHYLLGERMPMTALMPWNADGTRLLGRMHSDYLRTLYLDNPLAVANTAWAGRRCNGATCAADLWRRHAARPHRAVALGVQAAAITEPPMTIVLTAVGHNVGIVDSPGQAQSSYRTRRRAPGDPG